MFKKMVVLGIAVALITLGLFVDPSAAQVASTSKRGSLLIFPKVFTYDGYDTIITIGNDSSAGTNVKCYWMDANQTPYDFEFYVSGYGPVWFTAKEGYGTVEISPFGADTNGELKCWAIDFPAQDGALEELKKFNFLYGSALVVQTGAQPNAFEYDAWTFALNDTPILPSGPLNLDGAEYDTCPAYLTYNFFPEGAFVGDYTPPTTVVAGASTLSLSPCYQDLRQDRKPVCTKAEFSVWNEDEIKFTGAWQCIKCYYEGVLSAIGNSSAYWNRCDLYDPYLPGFPFPGKCKKTGVQGNKFTVATLHTDFARFRAAPSLSTQCNGVFSRLGQDGVTPVDVCAGNQVKSPFVGVLMTQLTVATVSTRNIATDGTGAGKFISAVPTIQWDAAQVYVDGAPGR